MNKFLNNTLFTFVIAFLTLMVIYIPNLSIVSISHDNTRYFASYNVDKTCNDDEQNGLLHSIGRPVTASIECAVVKYVKQLEDIKKIRLVVLIFLATAISLLVADFVSIGLDRYSSVLIALFLFTLPGVENIVFMSNIPNSVVLILSFLAAYIQVRSDRTIILSIFGGILACSLLSFAMFIYPALVFSFFWVTLVKVIQKNYKSHRELIYLFLKDFLVFFIASIFYFLITKYYLHSAFQDSRYALSDTYKIDISISGMLVKLIQSLPHSSALWFFNSTNFIIDLLVYFVVIFFIGYFSFEKNRLDIMGLKFLLILLILLLSFTPILLGKNILLLQRTLLVSMGVITLIIVMGFFALLSKFFQGSPLKNKKSNSVMLILFLIILSYSSFTNLLNVWNTNIEMEFVRSQLSMYDGVPRRIHLVRPVNNNHGFNNYDSISDEFNRKTTDYKADILNFLKVVVNGMNYPTRPKLLSCDTTKLDCESIVKNNEVVVSYSDYAESFCKSENMALIDMNILIRATTKDKPKLVNLESLPECESREFRVSSNAIHTTHGVERAFDDSVLPDDFWEASINQPVILDVFYNKPIVISGYVFKSGESSNRMPIDWEVLGSNDGKNFTSIGIYNYNSWVANQTVKFNFDKLFEFSQYRFKFNHSFDYQLMRLYEIKLLLNENKK